MSAKARTPPARLRTGLLLAVVGGVMLPALAWVGLSAQLPPSAQRLAVLLMVMVQLVALSVAAWVLLTRRFLWPLERLTDRAQALTGERLSGALGDVGVDEFTPLVRALDEVGPRLAELHTRLRSAETQLQKSTMVDALTGLPNRGMMAELFGHESAAARRAGMSMALLHVGLDRFRTFNDTLGHAAGDELLVGMGRRIAATLRDSDFVCRSRGDEFLVLLPDASSWDRVARSAERLLRSIEQPLDLPRCGQRVSLSADIGIAMYPSDGSDFEALAHAAALALDRSKVLGRGLYSFYRPDLDQALRQRIETERELTSALERNEFELAFQPIVDASDGRPVGCEALLRWRHPQRGLLLPADFIEGARQCTLMGDIDAWVLDAACAQLASWRGQGLRPGKLALNLSVQQARNPALSDTLRAALQTHGLLPSDLELEVTEDAVLAEQGGAPKALARWRALGLGLTIDDFGTGYASLAQLRALRPERLKIDCSVVRGLARPSADRDLAEAMLAMARALDIEVVAEAVETEAQCHWLLDHGVVLQQGHLHGPPLLSTAYTAWLAEHARRPQPVALEA